ncbi:MAG: TatD family deoxyribonuclease, partial [Chitinophagaceae bacterium]
QPFIAIGEIGLDFYWDKTYTAQQYAAFHRQIALAQQYSLPIVIHSRNATDECIAVVEQYPGLQGVFHCFSGNEEQARRVMAAGFYLGIGGVVSFKNSGLDKVVQAIGLSHLVLETDAPYLAPVPYRGKRNEPAYTGLVAEKVAGLLDVPVAEIGKITTANAKKLFGIAENP